MPYPGGDDQITAIFLSIKRKKGLAAARAWYKKHQAEGTKGFKAAAKRGSRSKRTSKQH